MKKLSILVTIIFIALTVAPQAFGSSSAGNEPLTLTTLVSNMGDYEKKNITLVGTIVGACMSGCKLWLSDGAYKKGDPVALVWAKDDAFKFKTDAAGRKIKLQGFAVGKYVDLCAKEKQENQNPKNAATPSGKDKKDCDPPVKVGANSEKEGEKQLKSITFFATSVEYLK